MAKNYPVLKGPGKWKLLISLMGDQEGEPSFLRPTVIFVIKVGRKHEKIEVLVNGLKRLDSRGNKWQIVGEASFDLIFGGLLSASPCTVEFSIKNRQGSISIEKL